MGREEWKKIIQDDIDLFGTFGVAEFINLFQDGGEFLPLFANILINHLDEEGRKGAADVVEYGKEASGWKWDVTDLAIIVDRLDDDALTKMKKALEYFDFTGKDESLNGLFGIEK